MRFYSKKNRKFFVKQKKFFFVLSKVDHINLIKALKNETKSRSINKERKPFVLFIECFFILINQLKRYPEGDIKYKLIINNHNCVCVYVFIFYVAWTYCLF